MPTYRALVRQMVEMIATHEIEAADEEAAVKATREFLNGNTAALDFSEADGSPDPATVYAVLDEDDETVWEDLHDR